MRVTFYHFPLEMPARERAHIIKDFDAKSVQSLSENTCSSKFQCKPSVAKKLLKMYGGEAYMEFIGRDGKKAWQILPITINKTQSKLKELRKKAGLSQKDLAVKLNVCQSTIHSWETYKSLPRRCKIKAIARALNCREDDFFNDIAEHIRQYSY